MNETTKTYRITFHNQGKIYEIYAKTVHQSALFGFIEIEEIVFGEKTSIVVDPSEENLKSEFADVARTYIPMHSVVRIDEVEKMGQSKITKNDGSAGTVTPFPVLAPNHESSKT